MRSIVWSATVDHSNEGWVIHCWYWICIILLGTDTESQYLMYWIVTSVAFTCSSCISGAIIPTRFQFQNVPIQIQMSNSFLLSEVPPKNRTISKSKNALHPKHSNYSITLDGGYLKETISHFLTLRSTKLSDATKQSTGPGALHDKGGLPSGIYESRKPKVN